MKKKKKLLVLSSTFPRWKDDTIPPFVYELSKRLTDDFDVHVLAPHFPGAKTEEIMDNMKVHRFRYFINKYQKLAGSGGILPTLKKNKFFYFQVPFFLLGEYLALRKLTKKIKPDTIHAHWIIPQGLIAYLNKKRGGADYVVTSHGSDILGLKGFKKLKQKIMHNAKSVTVVSNAIKKEVLETIDSSLEDKIRVIPMGVDSKKFNPKKKDNSIKKKYKINGPFLLFVGRLAPEKGITYLIEAMPEVIKSNPKTKLMIIGSGTLEEEIKNRVKELNIQDNIIFMGWVNHDDLPKYYATADIFVSPSLREGTPVTYIECLSCGTPILVGDIPISKEIIEIDKNNGLVTIQNSNNIEKNLLTFLKKKKLKVNSNKIKKIYDWGIISKKFERVLG